MKERSSTREIRRECALEIRPCKFLPRHVTCVLSHKKCWWIDRQQWSPREFQISHRDVHTFFFFFSFSFLTSFFFCSHRLWQFEKNTIFPWSERLLFLSIPVDISFYFLLLFFFFFFPKMKHRRRCIWTPPPLSFVLIMSILCVVQAHRKVRGRVHWEKRHVTLNII